MKRAVSQSGVYLIVVTSLWVLAGHGIESVLLSWALLFVADDWGIIANYRRLLRGHMFKLDHARIHSFNVLLASALVITLLRERGEIPVSVIFALFVLLAIFLSWRYAYENARAPSSDIAAETDYIEHGAGEHLTEVR